MSFVERVFAGIRFTPVSFLDFKHHWWNESLAAATVTMDHTVAAPLMVLTSVEGSAMETTGFPFGGVFSHRTSSFGPFLDGGFCHTSWQPHKLLRHPFCIGSGGGPFIEGSNFTPSKQSL